MTEPSQNGTGARALLTDLSNLPNLMSAARIVLIYLSMALWMHGQYGIGVTLGVVAGLSDYADGILARRLGQTTRIGAILDRAADLLFILGAAFMFIRVGVWPAVLLYVLLTREVVVLCLRASAAEMSFSLPSILLGKVASNVMFYSLALMGVAKGHLLSPPFEGHLTAVAYYAMLIGTALSVITALAYVRQYATHYRSGA